MLRMCAKTEAAHSNLCVFVWIGFGLVERINARTRNIHVDGTLTKEQIVMHYTGQSLTKPSQSVIHEMDCSMNIGDLKLMTNHLVNGAHHTYAQYDKHVCLIAKSIHKKQTPNRKFIQFHIRRACLFFAIFCCSPMYPDSSIHTNFQINSLSSFIR